MNGRYTNERNIQMVIALMKAHNIHKVVASPGTTNITFVASIQDDPFFEIYSSVDERSAAYIACGLSEESGEAVALTCTGATASRNYLSGLTEAYYRKLPILAITSTQHVGRIGQNIAQVIDRTEIQNDVAKLSVQIPAIHDAEDEWAYNVMLNKGIKGHILNVTSSSALRPAWTPYQMSKWAVKGLTLGLADMMIPHGIVVNAIAPGPTATPMLGKEAGDNIYEPYTPSRRYAMPEELASLAVFMVSGAGDMIVGDTFYMTGGSGTITLHH